MYCIKLRTPHSKRFGRNIGNNSGGGGNRTRVPWHFSARFYVCSLSILELFTRVRFALPRQAGSRQSYRSEFLATAASEAVNLAANLEPSRS
jgi:hypothetical protein